MNQVRTRLLAAAIIAALMTLGGAVASVGYIDQTQIQVILSGPNVVRCNRVATVSARVVSTKNGKPVGNQIVNWSLSGRSGSDGISAGSTVTNKRGRTAVTVRFGPVAGSRTVRAGAAATRPSITIRCAGGLPKTAPRPPAGFEAPVSDALLLPDSRHRPRGDDRAAPGDRDPPRAPWHRPAARRRRRAGRSRGCRCPLPGDGVARRGLQHVHLRARSRRSVPRPLEGPDG